MVSLVTFSTVFLIMIINGVKTGAQMNETNNGNTFDDYTLGKNLYDAASHGNLTEVKMLTLDQCIGVNWHDVFMATPLHTAALNNHPKVVMFLLSCNADPNRKTNTGWTPLMYASRSADGDVVKALLTANPDLDVQKYDGWTALMLASNTNRLDNVKALISAGANLELKNDFGKTAEDIAMKRGSMDIVQLLIQDTDDSTNISSNIMFELDICLAFVVFIVVSLTIGGCLYFTSKIITMPSSLKTLKVFTIEDDRKILNINGYSSDEELC